MLQSNGDCDREVNQRVHAGWNGWRQGTGVTCDRRLSSRTKGNVYKTVVRPSMLYSMETVPIKKRQEVELEVATLKMLHVTTSAYSSMIPTYISILILKTNVK